MLDQSMPSLDIAFSGNSEALSDTATTMVQLLNSIEELKAQVTHLQEENRVQHQKSEELKKEVKDLIENNRTAHVWFTDKIYELRPEPSDLEERRSTILMALLSSHNGSMKRKKAAEIMGLSRHQMADLLNSVKGLVGDVKAAHNGREHVLILRSPHRRG